MKHLYPSVTAIIPTLNAEAFLEDCLRSVLAIRPERIVVVDGGSTDRTRAIATQVGVEVIDDERRGVSAARQLGVEMAQTEFVLLVDADVVLPSIKLSALVSELSKRGLEGLQFTLHNVSIGQGYWGRALAAHSERSLAGSAWFSFSAALFRRKTLLDYPFDPDITSGEDMELRRRLKQGGVTLGLSKLPPALHRFDDSFRFAIDQWLADGRGLANVLWKSGWRSVWVVGIPLGAFVRGVASSIVHRKAPSVEYYTLLGFFNYLGFLDGLRSIGRRRRRAQPKLRPRRQILYVTPHYLPSIGGTEVHVSEVARRIAGDEFDVTVLTTAARTLRGGEDARSHEPAHYRANDFRILRVRRWPAFTDYFISPGLFAIILKREWDIVHLQGIHSFVAPITLVAARYARTPYVVTLHSGHHSSRVRNAIRPIWWRIQRPLFRNAKQLIAVSEFERARFASLLGLPASRFTVIPSGVDLPAQGAGRPVATEAEPLIVSIGRLERYKGHRRVVRAFAHLANRVDGAQLLILGQGPDAPALRRLARKLGVSERVEIRAIPAAAREQLGSVLRAAALVISLSEYESQGIAAMEAIGLRRPVLVDAGSALGELARQGLATPVERGASDLEVAERMLRVLENPPTPAAHKLPTWDEAARETAELYRSLLATRDGSVTESCYPTSPA